MIRNPDQDPDGYVAIAREWQAGTYGRPGLGPTAFRPPGYVLAIAPWCWLGGENVTWGIAGMHLLAAGITTAVVIRLAHHGINRRAGVIAGLIVAFDPILIHQSTQIMTETIFTTLLVVSMGLLRLDSREPIGIPRSLLAGLGWGLAGLTRPIAWPVLAILLLISPRRRWASSAIVLAAALIAASPWVVRNQQVFGQPILTTTHGGYTLWLGQNPVFYREVVAGENQIWPEESFREWTAANARRTQGMNEVESDQALRADALRWMREHPAQASWSCLRHLGWFWSPWPRATSAGIRSAVGVYYLAVFALAGAGLFRLGSANFARPWVGLLAVMLVFSLFHSVYWSDMRMRAPVMPLVALLAARGLCRRESK